MQKSIIIIPARFHSSRFPGKSLEMIDEYNVIQSVYLRAKQVNNAEKVIVATDDQRIKDSIDSIGGEAIITKEEHQNGTSRIAEVARQFPQFNLVINVQGDEPFIDPVAIQDLIAHLKERKQSIVTLKKKCGINEVFDVNTVKVISEDGIAKHFLRRREDETVQRPEYFKHIGIYGFLIDTLLEIVNLEPTQSEINESLEQLRWLENGYDIGVIETVSESIGIDVPSDLEKARQFANSLS